MHLKRLYKALAIVITVAMILPQTWITTFAEGGVEEAVVLADEPVATAEPISEAPVTAAPVTEVPLTEAPAAEDTVTKAPLEEEPTESPTDELPTAPDTSDTLTETPGETSTPTVTPELTGTPTVTPTPTGTLELTVTPTPTEAPDVTDVPAAPADDTTEDGSSNPIAGFGSNAALVSAQQIVMPPIELDAYRFKTIDKVYAVTTSNLIVREDQAVEARAVGQISQDGLCFIIKEIQDSEWVFIESGLVRGFVKAEFLITGEEAIAIVDEVREENMTLAEATLDPLENRAYTYVRETVRETKAEKIYAIASELVSVMDGKDATDKAIGELPKDTICYILADDGDEWIFVEADDVRGFVQRDLMIVGEEAEQILANGSSWTEERELELAEQELLLSQKHNELNTQTADKKQAEEELAEAVTSEDADAVYALEVRIAELDAQIVATQVALEEQVIIADELKADRDYSFGQNVADAPRATKLVEPEDNKAFYYTITSTKENSVSGSIGRAMVEFASQFLGNPYVWGGTSLTNGADCSGFVQGIYSQFGYSLPRTSGEQSQVGMQIPVSEAKTGDLIFYARNGVVYHVVMYINEGQVIHASNSRTGIIVSGIDTEHAVWATRMISDNDTDKVEAVNAKAGTMMYGGSYTNATQADVGELLGNFKLTSYCNCAICCGKWAGGPTASGTTPIEGRTVAMAGLPFGTRLVINGKLYTVEDRGTPYGHVDIYMNSHDEATIFGVQYADVYLAR